MKMFSNCSCGSWRRTSWTSAFSCGCSSRTARRCSTGSTPTGRSSWQTMLTLGETTVKQHFVDSFFATNQNHFCQFVFSPHISLNIALIAGSASKLQEEHSQFTVASNVSQSQFEQDWFDFIKKCKSISTSCKISLTLSSLSLFQWTLSNLIFSIQSTQLDLSF